MKIDILKEYASLEAMETKELLQVWNRHFDVPPQSRNNRTYLINQITYRMQELTYGGLTKSILILGQVTHGKILPSIIVMLKQDWSFLGITILMVIR